jgi:hypothetical protein
MGMKRLIPLLLCAALAWPAAAEAKVFLTQQEARSWLHREFDPASVSRCERDSSRKIVCAVVQRKRHRECRFRGEVRKYRHGVQRVDARGVECDSY